MDGSSSTFVEHASSALKEGDRREAIELVEPWLRLSPDDAGAWEIAGAAYFELGDWQEAEHAAREAVRLMPDNARSWCNLGTVLRKAGKPEEAQQAVSEALAIEPGLARANSERDRLTRRPSRKTRTRKNVKASGVPRVEQEWLPEHDAELEVRDGEWKVRSPEGAAYGPYDTEQLCAFVGQGIVGREWRARCGSGRVMAVREAIGPALCDELLRQRAATEATERASQQAALRADVAQPSHEVAPVPPDETSTVRCPHCGQSSVWVEKRDASSARTAIILLGLILWPLWLVYCPPKVGPVVMLVLAGIWTQ